jgi:hypothetical protein
MPTRQSVAVNYINLGHFSRVLKNASWFSPLPFKISQGSFKTFRIFYNGKIDALDEHDGDKNEK